MLHSVSTVIAFVPQFLSVIFCISKRSCIGIGKGHLRVVGSFSFSKETFFLLVGKVWLFFSFMIFFWFYDFFLNIIVVLALTVY